MKIDLDAHFKTLSGQTLRRPAREGEDKPQDLRVGEVIAEALLAPPEQGQSFTVSQTLERFSLAQVAFKGGEADITAAQAVLIQDSAARVLTPLVAGQIIALTDGK